MKIERHHRQLIWCTLIAAVIGAAATSWFSSCGEENDRQPAPLAVATPELSPTETPAAMSPVAAPQESAPPPAESPEVTSPAPTPEEEAPTEEEEAPEDEEEAPEESVPTPTPQEP